MNRGNVKILLWLAIGLTLRHIECVMDATGYIINIIGILPTRSSPSPPFQSDPWKIYKYMGVRRTKTKETRQSINIHSSSNFSFDSIINEFPNLMKPWIGNRRIVSNFNPIGPSNKTQTPHLSLKKNNYQPNKLNQSRDFIYELTRCKRNKRVVRIK